jgi:hypothetical protein
MRGHQPLIAMRHRGVVPDAVFVETDDLDLRRLPVDPVHLDLHITPSDNLNRLDLRCLVGLKCFVCGTNTERVQAVAQACRQAQASRVIELAPDHITDTEGSCEWHAS